MKEKKLGQGKSIQGFESLEEMQRYLLAEERSMIARTLPEQWNITWGARVVRNADGLPIFGHVFTEREFLGESITGDPAQDEETMAELDDLRDAHERGYRYGRWYSTVEPDGEYGSAHVVALWEITETDFERARAGGWTLWPELAERVYTEQSQAIANQERNKEE
jgi:hypothetical protein